MKTAIFAFGAIREIEMVSGWPGVTKPSEPTFAFRKMNLVFGLDLEETSARGLPAAPVTGRIAAHASATNPVTNLWFPLPVGTAVTIAGHRRHGKRGSDSQFWVRRIRKLRRIWEPVSANCECGRWPNGANSGRFRLTRMCRR